MDVSQQIHRIYTEARDIARSSGKVLGSAQLLLAMFTEETAPNQARTVLEQVGVNADRILDALPELGPESEETMQAVRDKTEMTAMSCGAELVNSLHLLLGIFGVQQSLAYRVIERLGVSIGELRVKVFSYVTGVLPRRFFQHAQSFQAQPPTLPAMDWMAVDGGGSVRRGGEAAEAELVWDDEPPAPPRRARRSFTIGDEEREAVSARALAQLISEVARQRTMPVPTVRRPGGGASRFALDPELYPVLSALGRNLTEEAERGHLDPLIGREAELDQVLDILHKRRANNPCLIGDPGVGKTAIVEGVAARLVAEAESRGEVRALVELNVSALVAGTQLRGSFSERMGELRKEVRRAERSVILFIDEIHTLLGAGAGSGPLDAANDLKSALARGEFPCIGATTSREYRQHIESDAALERRFQPILVEEPSQDEARAILSGVLPRYESYHGVAYAPECVGAAVRLSARYVADRRLPDKALNLVDLAGARAARGGQAEVSPADIAGVVAKLSGIPRERLLMSEAERLLTMEGFLKERIIGHDEVMARIAATVQRNSAGFRSRRPIGSFLLMGPTGVGKTETVRVLADFLFQDREAVTRFDMSEYIEAHSVSKLIGSAPGYVGHDEGGQLTESVHRRPYQIILFDEIEKASREVVQTLLQVLEEGSLTDGKGRRVSFANTVVAMTSNVGGEEFERRRHGFGFVGVRDAQSAREREEAERVVLEGARRSFSPELWNRLDEKLVYHPLGRAHVATIAELLLAESAARLETEAGISYRVAPAVIEHLIVNGGFDERHGARPMRRTIQRLVEGAVSKDILGGRVRSGSVLRVEVVQGEIITRVDEGDLVPLSVLP